MFSNKTKWVKNKKIDVDDDAMLLLSYDTEVGIIITVKNLHIIRTLVQLQLRFQRCSYHQLLGIFGWMHANIYISSSLTPRLIPFLKTEKSEEFEP